jgi:hypothetical protein
MERKWNAIYKTYGTYLYTHTFSLLSELSMSKLLFFPAMVGTVVLLIVTSSGDWGGGPE